jgi:hypothetical protein
VSNNYGVMAGHSPRKTGVNALNVPAIHVLAKHSEDVDARHKAGHDDIKTADRAIAPVCLE